MLVRRWRCRWGLRLGEGFSEGVPPRARERSTASRSRSRSRSTRGLSLLSQALSEIASDSRGRKELLEQVKAIGRIIRRPDWDPNSTRASSSLGFTLTPHHVTHLINGLSTRNHRGSAIDTYTDEYSSGTSACGGSGELPDAPVWALRIYIWAARQPGYRHNAIIRSLVLELWEPRELVLPFLHVVDDPSLLNSPEKFTLLIQGYGLARMPDMAMSTLTRMTASGFDPDVTHFNALLFVLVHENRLPTMRELFKHMRDRGIIPDASTYALRVRAYAASGQFEEALKAFRQMLKARFRPDLKTFGYLIDSMCKAKRTRLLYVILVDLHEHRCSPDVSIYHELLEGLCRNDCVKDAEKVVKLIRERGINPSSFVCNVLAKGQCREGKVQCALTQVNDMIKHGFLPNPDVFDLLLINLFKNGRIGNICKLLSKLVDRGFVPPMSSYNILIYGMCKCEEIDKAFESWGILVRFCLPSVKVYRALIEGLCQSGRVAEAKLVFQTTMEKGGTGDDAAHDVLILRLKQAGRLNDARECQGILDERRRRKTHDDEDLGRSFLEITTDHGHREKNVEDENYGSEDFSDDEKF